MAEVAGQTPGQQFVAAMEHHNLPQPAIEPVHGRPVLIFNVGRYAQLYLHELRADPGFAQVSARPAYRAWAAELAPGPAAEDLARGMEVAASRSWLGAFPRPLAWVNQQTFFGTVALVVVAILLTLAARQRRGRLQQAFEAVVLFVRNDIARANLGPAADAWTPLLASVFMALLAFNLMGLLPGGGTASANLGVNVGFAVAILLAMFWGGMVRSGVIGFWRHLVPYTWSWNPLDMMIWTILLVVEVMGLIIRPGALAIRLFANMFAGHTILLALSMLGSMIVGSGSSDAVAVPLGIFGILLLVAIYALELLVAVLQAYIFTLLGAVFIGAAVNPDH